MIEYVVKGNDFSEWDNDKNVSLKKIDKNDTHYYISSKCPKCGGTGYLPYYDYNEGGICFLCDGTGIHEITHKVMTEAYSEKLRLKRLEKIRKEATEKNARFLADIGFNADGQTWIVLGNTYQIRDDLKAAGAKYSRMLGWAFPFEQSKYDTLEISKDTEIEEKYSEYLKGYLEADEYSDAVEHDTLIQADCNGVYGFTNSADIEKWLKDKKQERELKLKAERGAVSEYVGEIGEKITATVTVTRISYFDTHYTYFGEIQTIYTMEDEAGNQLVWKTESGFKDDIQTGAKLTITGTVKTHSTFQGEKQTELTRVKELGIKKAEKKEDRSEEEIEPYNDDADKAIEEALRMLDEAV